MTPRFARDVRRALPKLLVVLFFIGIVSLFWKIAYGGGLTIGPLFPKEEPVAEVVPVEPQLEWMVVNANNTLVWPFKRGTCQKNKAHSQWHKGEVVLVISRQDNYIEVESDKDRGPLSRGCINEKLLDPYHNKD